LLSSRCFKIFYSRLKEPAFSLSRRANSPLRNSHLILSLASLPQSAILFVSSCLSIHFGNKYETKIILYTGVEQLVYSLFLIALTLLELSSKPKQVKEWLRSRKYNSVNHIGSFTESDIKLKAIETIKSNLRHVSTWHYDDKLGELEDQLTRGVPRRRASDPA